MYVCMYIYIYVCVCIYIHYRGDKSLTSGPLGSLLDAN